MATVSSPACYRARLLWQLRRLQIALSFCFSSRTSLLADAKCMNRPACWPLGLSAEWRSAPVWCWAGISVWGSPPCRLPCLCRLQNQALEKPLSGVTAQLYDPLPAGGVWFGLGWWQPGCRCSWARVGGQTQEKAERRLVREPHHWGQPSQALGRDLWWAVLESGGHGLLGCSVRPYPPCKSRAWHGWASRCCTYRHGCRGLPVLRWMWPAHPVLHSDFPGTHQPHRSTTEKRRNNHEQREISDRSKQMFIHTKSWGPSHLAQLLFQLSFFLSVYLTGLLQSCQLLSQSSDIVL